MPKIPVDDMSPRDAFAAGMEAAARILRIFAGDLDRKWSALGGPSDYCCASTTRTVLAGAAEALDRGVAKARQIPR